MKSTLNIIFFVFSNIIFANVFAAEMTVDVSGNWVGVVELENGQELPFGLELNQQEGELTGVLAGIGTPDIEVMDVRLEDNILYFSSLRPINDQNVAFDYIAVISADYMNITIIRVGATGPNSVLSTMTRRQ